MKQYRKKHTLKCPPGLSSHGYYTPWLEFHTRNVHVIHEIISRLETYLIKREHTSIKKIVYNMRNEVDVDHNQKYKFNDAYTSIYAHVIIYNFPKYASIIKTKKLRA